MRILQLCNKPPLPAIDGGCKAMHQTTQMLLASSNKVKVLSLHTKKHPIVKNAMNEQYLSATNFESVFIDTSINIFDAVKNINSEIPYNVKRFYSIEFEKKLIEILSANQFDIIIFESIYMSEYLKIVQQNSTAKCVLRSHNIEYILWESRTEIEQNFIHKTYSKFLTSKLEEYEKKMFQNFKNIIAITEEDALEIKKSAPYNNIISIPFASIKPKISTSQKQHPLFYHLGAMDWQPNIDAVDWTLNNILPTVIKAHPNFKFHIAGRGVPIKYFNLQNKNFQVDNAVDDAIDYINAHDVLVAPIFSGGGMRVKIVEAMQLGKIVITTSLGATGIQTTYENLPCILIANNKEEFINHISDCLSNFEHRKIISANAQKAIENSFGFEIISERLNKYLSDL